MQLVERHIITKYNKNWKEIDHLCYLSKNLYNSAIYHIKKILEETGKFTNYYKLNKIFKEEKQVNYMSLPIQSSQQCMIQVDNTLKSYFALVKLWKSDKKSKLKTCPQLPKYKDKKTGRNVIIFTNQQCKIKDELIHFPKRSNLLPIKTNVSRINQVRLVPTSGCYVVEVIYTEEEQVMIKNDHFLSIDPGINNLLTIYDSKNNTSFIIDGRKIKQINQYYNKKKGEKQSQIKKNHNKNWCKSLSKLTFKRNNKINDYLHKSSRFVVNYCIENEIQNIVVGHNKEWKQELALGKKTNQNFTQIPFNKLFQQLQYKSTLVGIDFFEINEAYTSKCSSLDKEPICKHDAYLGKRTKRGQFISKNNIKINADLNGAINILRKVRPDKAIQVIEKQTLRTTGQVFWPVKIKSL
jgi:putative transposase